MLFTKSSKTVLFAMSAMMSFIFADVMVVTTATPTHLVAEAERSKTGSTTKPNLADFSSVVDCPARHYYNKADMICKPCSKCPVNQIIRSLCTVHQDTVCGPFFEFDKFHQSPVDTKSGATQHGKPFKNEIHKKEHQDSEETSESDLKTASLDKARNQWRTLSFALISVLSFICCLIIVVGFYVCIACRQSRLQTELVKEPELLASYPSTESEPRYVETFVTSCDRLRTDRQIPVYQQILTGLDVPEYPHLLSSQSGKEKEDAVDREADEKDCYIYINSAAFDDLS